MNTQKLKRLEDKAALPLRAELDFLAKPVVNRMLEILTQDELSVMDDFMRAGGEIVDHPLWKKVLSDSTVAKLLGPVEKFYIRAEKRGLLNLLNLR